jgi:hypothetical protein
VLRLEDVTSGAPFVDSLFNLRNMVWLVAELNPHTNELGESRLLLSSSNLACLS